MISEKTFAGEFTGFWVECLPFLTPQVIAELNLSGSPMLDRRGKRINPLTGAGDNSNNDVIAEIAFELFAESLKRGKTVADLCGNRALVKNIEQRAKQRILGLRGDREGRPHRATLNVDEAMALATRLEASFHHLPRKSIIIQPRFKGCGILDSCYGDVLAGTNLVELKMVDRNLRSADIRQLLVYCALNHRSSQYEINMVTVSNPRRGVEFAFQVEDLAESAAGKTSAELFHQISAFLSDFEIVHQPS